MSKSSNPRSLAPRLIEYLFRFAALAADDDRSRPGGEVRLIVKVHAEKPVGVEPRVERGGRAAEHPQAQRGDKVLPERSLAALGAVELCADEKLRR